MPVDILQGFLGVYLPPVGVCMQKDAGCLDIVINLVLCLLFPLAVFHHFHLLHYDPVTNICCLCIPPLGVYLGTKELMDALICFICWIIGFGFLGIWYAYVKA